MRKGLIFFLLLPVLLLAKENSYHIGDVIRFRIEGLAETPEEIMEKLKSFEVVKQERENNGFVIWLRSFEPGKKELIFGKTTLRFEIESLLSGSDRKDIYDIKDGDETSALKRPTLPFFWTLWIGIFLLLGLPWCVYFIRRTKNARIQGYLSPIQWFENMLANLDDFHFLEGLTDALKGYVERKYAKQIMGKTSSEILKELNFSPVAESLSTLRPWLEELDDYKYAGIEVTIDRMQRLREMLLEWVSALEKEEADVQAA